jgi:hypothetical protein
MSIERYEYECALTGLTTPGSIYYKEDKLDDLPQGWTEVKLSRRVFNSKWVAIQQVKRAMAEGLVGQLPGEARGPQEIAIRLQVDAQFHNMEKDTPIFVTEIETVYLSPRETSEEVADAYDEARELLGLDPIEADEDEGEDEDEGSEPRGKEAGAMEG